MSRIKELDYLKAIFILLMIAFHLVYIGDKYPYAKQVVYTFHMPAFLLISGYLVNINKDAKPFFYGMLWIFIPYSVMELGYVVMSSVLPVRESVAEVTPAVLLSKVFLFPIGPYWYLHTLVVCSIAYYLINKFLLKIHSKVLLLLTLSLCFFFISDVFGIISFANAIYFMGGVAIAQYRQSFTDLFYPSLWLCIPLVALCCFPSNLDRFTLGGLTITYLVISLSLAFYRYGPEKIKIISHFLGKNTLIILLFSPIFTILSKALVPYFAFEPSGILYLLVSVVFVVGGCLGIAWIMDKLNLSRFFIGKKQMLKYE